MLNKLFRFTILALFLWGALYARQSFAYDYEVRTPFGASLVNPANLNSMQIPPLEVRYAMNFGIDGLFGYGGYSVGLRYDSVSAIRSDGQKDGTSLEISAHLFELLARREWEIGDDRFIGLIGAVGVYTPSFVNTHEGGSAWLQHRADDAKAISLGSEIGWYWDPFVVGLEGGYEYIVLQNLKTDGGVALADGNGRGRKKLISAGPT